MICSGAIALSLALASVPAYPVDSDRCANAVVIDEVVPFFVGREARPRFLVTLRNTGEEAVTASCVYFSLSIVVDGRAHVRRRDGTLAHIVPAFTQPGGKRVETVDVDTFGQPASMPLVDGRHTLQVRIGESRSQPVVFVWTR